MKRDANGRPFISKKDIFAAFEAVGLNSGQNVMVHCSLSSIGFVCGGAQVLIEALMERIGSDGTLLMPAQSWKNLDPETGVHWEEPKDWWNAIRENWPAYNKFITPTNTMGAVAEMFRQWPGTLRSDHPARSICAWGKGAAYFTENHDLSNIFGEGSPFCRLYEQDGYVLLIGVDYDKNTCLHLADSRAEYSSKHTCLEHSAILENGKRIWKEYETLAVDGEDFIEIGKAFEKAAKAPRSSFEKVRKVKLGNACLRFMKVRSLVDFAVNWIEENRK